MKKFVVGSLALMLSAMLISCGGAKKEETTVAQVETTAAQTESAKEEETEKAAEGEKTEVQVFVAASLKNVMEDLGQQYEKENPSVKLVFQADSSGKLLTQIQEGYACDVFFSAAQKQMDTLQEEGKLVEGTRQNVVNNQLCVITRKNSGTKVTGLETLKDAKSIALADGTVPVGKYTRKALVSLGILPEAEDLSKISTKEVSDALGGVEISEQSNVSKVLAAVVEGSSEVGTTYYSDTYGKEADVEILEKVSYDLTGNVIYPISQIVNDEASEAEVAEAKKFVEFVCSDAAKETFQKYYFDTNVE
ncbi:molybdate ABC transporter substrate-binding protein [Oribacterium parvum]|uniref:molybdate ABC transporter substrate-binding protein n=1 Tax=Oribacterium parvum TaxID=1501329 RepID=UPI0028EE3778|nr:molybdate ABC transporter substrate-binding protein [Oribacterium parvum]